MHERQRGDLPKVREFVSREDFLGGLIGFVDYLAKNEESLSDAETKKQFTRTIRKTLEDLKIHCSPEEGEISERVFNLFSIKHSLSPHFPETCKFFQGRGKQELSVEVAGPIAVGKTTVGSFLADQIGARSYKEEFQSDANPFCERAYHDSDFMLRSQLSFLLSGIETGLKAKFQSGRWVRDASPWSDIFVFMEWRRMAGIVSEAEHRAYMEMVDLLNKFTVPHKRK